MNALIFLSFSSGLLDLNIKLRQIGHTNDGDSSIRGYRILNTILCWTPKYLLVQRLNAIKQ